MIVLFLIFNLNFPFFIFIPLFCCWRPSSRNREDTEFESTEFTEEPEVPQSYKSNEKEISTNIIYLTCPTCGIRIDEKNLRFCPHCGRKMR